MEAGILLKRSRRERRSRGDKPQHALQGLDAMMVIAMIVMMIRPIVATPYAISALGGRPRRVLAWCMVSACGRCRWQYGGIAGLPGDRGPGRSLIAR
jgi:hypothetical protein